jgi:hypothetical protein
LFIIDSGFTWLKLSKTGATFFYWGAASLKLTVLSTDTGLAGDTAEHFNTCYNEAIYVSIEANGYTTSFDCGLTLISLTLG